MTDALAAHGWQHSYSGKVRDLYEHAEHPSFMLVIASDRSVRSTTCWSRASRGKGALLTELSRWWFDQLDVPNHLATGSDVPAVPAEVADRAMLVATTRHAPRGMRRAAATFSGSGWLEYQQSQSVCGIALPAGLRDGDRLPEPIYTPAWKAPLGEHDENITFERSGELVGAPVAAALRDASLAIFARASTLAAARGGHSPPTPSSSSAPTPPRVS